eukprot:TRINITY_DN10883_c0_g2_i3.p1 TRINITY_DN10883_c0_g2~~TRINITY_DN10883_c0_g2_i3.p1  ORF type:complete len:1005 (+),score=244.79 TRINITY_DN10883_c0_g2_i3:33-3017(+)
MDELGSVLNGIDLNGSASAEPARSDVPASPNDKRKYRMLRLHNGLRALLVSNGYRNDIDADERMAAAALRVGVGSFNDPQQVQGLAHFLEHMVFMGSKKYPKEDTFDAFLGEHGGSSNAHTDAEETCYVFEVESEYLEPALDMFADLVVAPLLREDGAEREVEAVNSEFEMNQQHDGCRRQQLLAHIAQESHPMHGFSWGNRQSLIEEPLKASTNVNAALNKFYQDEYHTSRMTLVVLGAEKLEDLEKLVMDKFGSFPAADVQDASLAGEPLPIAMETLHMYYPIKTVRDVNDLGLVFVLPSMSPHWRSKPVALLAELIGHEGKGSALNALKQRGWAISLSAGCSGTNFEANSNYCIFELCASLTDEGVQHKAEVLEIIFAYIAFIRTSSDEQFRSFYNEVSAIAAAAYRCLDETDDFDYVSELACQIPQFPDEHALDGEAVYFEYNIEVYRQVIDELCADKCLVYFASQNNLTENEVNLIEPWFKTQYGQQAIPAEWLQRWKAAEASSPFSELTWPTPNPYITTDFELIKRGEKMAQPQLVKQTEACNLWYMQDRAFNTPHASIKVAMHSPIWFGSNTNAAYMNIYMALIDDAIQEQLYPASVADLSFEVKGKTDALVISVRGLSQKLVELFSNVVTFIKTFSPSQDKFDIMLKQVHRAQSNLRLDAGRAAGHARAKALFIRAYHPVDILNGLDGCTYKGFLYFCESAFASLRSDAYVHGNLSQQDAEEVVRLVTETWPGQALPASDILVQRLLSVPEGLTLVRGTNANPEDANNACQFYFQCQDTSLRAKVVAQLIGDILEDPAFNVLRTQQQLGYSVSFSWRWSYGYPGWLMTIESQGKNYTVDEVHRRVDAFLSDSLATLEEIEDEAFDSHVESLIHAKLRTDHNMFEQASRFWGDIDLRTYDFDALEREAQDLEEVELEDVIVAFKKYLLPKSPARRALALMVSSQDEPVDATPITAASSYTMDELDVLRAEHAFLAVPYNPLRNDLRA